MHTHIWGGEGMKQKIRIECQNSTRWVENFCVLYIKIYDILHMYVLSMYQVAKTGFILEVSFVKIFGNICQFLEYFTERTNSQVSSKTILVHILMKVFLTCLLLCSEIQIYYEKFFNSIVKILTY